MKRIEISVQNRVAWQTNSTDYICGNSDFVVGFVFDSEWDEFETKTARFIHGGEHTDIVFTGTECKVPKILNVKRMEVGVFAGDLYTTTPAFVHCRKSILCDSGAPAAPTPDVYAQIMERLDSGVSSERIAQAVADYLRENPADQGSGLSTTAKNLLITILRNSVYSTDQSANITALENALASGGGEDPDIPDVPDEPDVPVVKTYSVNAELINVTSSNKVTAVNENASYTTTLTAADGYNLDSVTVIMGGADITATAYANGAISIPVVTGDVEIVASAVVIEETSAELVTDGLLAYFDFRTATYNNAESNGSTTIAATQGDGRLFAWQKNCVAVQDERGIHFASTRTNTYSQAGNTTETDIGTPMTLVMLTYGHVMAQGFIYENVGSQWAFKPRYNTTGGSTAYATQRSGVEYNADSKDDYNFCVYRVDGNTLTEIMDTSVTAYNGGDIDDFASWQTTVGIQAQNGTWDGVYCTAAAIYNRALTDVEIEEMRAFMKTLEVA